MRSILSRPNYQQFTDVLEDLAFSGKDEMHKVSVIDQFDAQDFNINEAGVIRSDISKLARAQSMSEYDAIMRRIGQNKPQYNVSDGMTIREAFDSVRPRQYQSPAELQHYVESLPYDSASLDDAYQKAVPDVPLSTDAGSDAGSDAK